MGHRDEHLTPQEIAELGALLAAERPRPSHAFAALLDARVEERFARPIAPRRARAARGGRPWLPAFAATAAVALVALVALVVATQVGGGPARPGGTARTFQNKSAAGSFAAASPPTAATPDAAGAPQGLELQMLDREARKVERSASLDLGAPPERVRDVAQDVLGVVARLGGIVDESNVATGAGGDGARFALRFPAARLEEALAQLSRLPHAHVLARSDDLLDVNQTFVSTRRRLAAAQAERAGLLRALSAGGTADELLRLRTRLAIVERTIAAAQRDQRALDRRISYSRVALSVSADAGGAGGGARFTPGRALHDAGRLLAITAGVVVIGAAGLVPLAVLLACAWPLARALRRRRREQALDAV